jgi:cytoskeletal protein CcmA (bactofilin family)
LTQPGDVSVIDGYTSVQAIRHSKGRGRAPSEPAAPPPPEPEPQKPASPDRLRIGHTIVPLRRSLVCYNCGYRFVLTGKFSKTYCPKCRHELDLTDHVIEHEFSGTLKTLGRVEIRPDSILSEATVIAGDVVVLGDATGASIEACGTVELCLGARFDLGRLRTPTLVISRGSRIEPDADLNCENLEIDGLLNARVYSSGTVTVHSGGVLAGELHGRHLCVEEGAGLTARVSVRPDWKETDHG